LCRQVLPLEIVYDNGKGFCNVIVHTLLKLWAPHWIGISTLPQWCLPTIQAITEA
jgi:hypothetical protein